MQILWSVIWRACIDSDDDAGQNQPGKETFLIADERMTMCLSKSYGAIKVEAEDRISWKMCVPCTCGSGGRLNRKDPQVLVQQNMKKTNC